MITVGAVVASVLSVASPPTRPGGATAVSPVSEAPDAASATLAAHAQGSAVEIADQRTSMRRVFANPGGGMTTELNPVPVRVKRGSAWVPIDTEVVRRPDGSVGPRAAVGDAVFSGGGSTTALASLHHDGRKLSLYWPGELPKPVLSGNTATYPEVLPGVDLVMRAERDGLQQHVVVKTREAAKNPALASIRMGMRADGLKVRVGEAGSLQAADDAGGVAFTAPPSTMWDSAGRTTRFDVSVVDDALVLAPDPGFLADPAVVYPVTIDPPWKAETFQRNAWATVLSGYPTQPYWWTSGEPGVAQAGQCWRDPQRDRCNDIGEAWAYFQFDTGFLSDKKVRRITFNTASVYSPSCGSRRHVLHGVYGAIGWPGPTWNTRPDGPRIAEFDAPLARGGCDANRAIGIELGAHYNPSGLSAYSIRALDGNDQLAWRKYSPEETSIRVEWNRAPNPPQDLTTDPPLRTPCRWCDGKTYMGDAQIRLIARLSDPDNDPVDPQWAIDRTRANGTPEDREYIGWGLGFGPSGQPRSHELNLSTADHGKTIAWEVRTGDGSEHTGPWKAAPRTFVVDRQGVLATPAVSSPAYPEDNAWHGGVGVPGVFTFGPGAPCDAQNTQGTCDIDHYVYGWQDQPTTEVVANALGGSATVNLAPPGDGPRILYVRSVDRANHHSPTKAHRFYVRAGNGPRSQWSFEGNTNDTAFLGDRHGTLNGNARIGAGAVGTGLNLDGTATTDMTAPTTVRTDASFSVAAWVKLDRTDGSRYTAVSQDGNSGYGFMLQYEGDSGQWVFVLPQSEASQGWDFVKADRTQHPPVAGAWTHLAGTFDAINWRISLYVNGVLAGTAQRNTLWHAPGPLRVGGVRINGQVATRWPGAIDEVQVYDRVITLGEIKAAVSRDNVRAGHWTFDERDGATAENSLEDGEALVLKEGARFTDDGAVKRAATFDGVNDHAVTGRSVVRTDRSFTVAAWVKADRFVTGGASMTAVSQDGARNSGFYLQYNSTAGKWVFVRFSVDSDSLPETGWAAAQAGQAPTAGWTHLAGTFDAATRRMTIYVNGQYGGETLLPFEPWDATGPLSIGRAKLRGVFTDYWPGAVDEVRMYNRALGPQELEGIVSRNDVPAASWKLDGNAVDDSAGHRDGTLNGTPAWTAGQSMNPDPRDLAISLDGADDYVKAPTTINTTQSYSVSAWVRLGQRKSDFQAVASQTSKDAAAFMLGHSGTGGSGSLPDRWAIQLVGPDRGLPETVRVNSNAPAQVGVWTHLAAVYQASTGEIWLYVNGVQSGYGKLDGKPTFNAQLEFDIGRGIWNTSYGFYFSGAIDDVKLYSRPLFDDEVRLMAGRDLPLVHNWRLDEPSGANVADHVGGRPGTMSGDVARGPGRVGNAARFNGTGAVRTELVDVATDQRFTVSAWVNLDRPSPCAAVCRSTAVSVDSGQTGVDSKFRLGHRIDQDQAPGPYGKWIFEMPERNGTITEAAISAEPGQFNRWVFLVGVYDAPAGQLWLYVYSNPDAPDFDSGTLQAPWTSTGGLRLGGSVRGGQAADQWRGSIDDVRMFTGDLDADRIGTLYRSYPTTAPSPDLPVPDKGYWKFDENTGTAAADSSGREQTATLQGDGAGWQAGGRIGHTSWLNGSTGFAATAGPVVDTTESFSVSVWAYLSAGDGTGRRTVIAQDGDAVSSFAVQYEPEKRRWKVMIPIKDEANATAKEVVSTGPPMVSPWTHLVVAYDKPLGQVRLYVNGQTPEVGVGLTPVRSTGPLSFGRAKRNGGNADFFPGGVDDVRVFGRALSDGEVRRIHDDAPSVSHGYWGFEGNVNDTSWRRNPTTGSGGITFKAAGIRGQALHFDGASGSVSTSYMGVNMLDSFTVSAWAQLTDGGHDATVVSQDGTRMSGFLVQYNKDIGRWVFGAAPDADFGQLVYAKSPTAPEINKWTHLAGVYDYPARQLRLYVNGELVDIKNDAPLWPTISGLTIGRGKENGVPADFFGGLLDEVQIDFWTVPDAEIAWRAGHPAPAGGQLGRFVNSNGEHYTANSTDSHEVPFAPVPAGYRFEGPLGKLLTAEVPDTRKLYACLTGIDEFTSVDPACGGAPARKLADLGWAYTGTQAGVPTLALYRCTTGSERFDSHDPNCEGRTREAELGHVLAYAALTRYVHKPDWEHTTTIVGGKPGYHNEGTLGLVAMIAVAGTQILWNCRDGALDEFVTTDPACAGRTPIGSWGRVWTEPPPGTASRPIYLCQATYGEWFNSIRPDCEGAATAPAIQIGYVLTAVPPA